MVQCNPHAISRGLDFVEFVACPKICMAESPRMVNATFSDDGMSIKVSDELRAREGREWCTQ